MSKSHAYRNLKICSKDCLCLFVCPTGAANNETGQIDFETCIGCGACMKACPARAITMIPNKLPAQAKKDNKVINELFKVADSKIKEIKILNYLLEKNPNDKLVRALIHSNRVILEDLMRESGYMLPQSKNTHELLNKLKSNDDIKDKVQRLLNKLEVNE